MKNFLEIKIAGHTPSFKELMGVSRQKKVELDLIAFVKFLHPKAEVSEKGQTVEAITAKSRFSYHRHGDNVARVNLSPIHKGGIDKIYPLN